MLLKRFYISVFIRVSLIVFTCITMGIVLPKLHQGYYYTLTGLVALIFFQTLLLIHEVNRTNSDLEKFFSSVNDTDSSITFTRIGEPSFASLRKKMNDLNQVIQQARIRNERSSQFLQSVVDHVNTGLLLYNGENEIELCNKAAANLLHIDHSDQLSSLKISNRTLYDAVMDITPGREKLLKVKGNNQQQSILLKASEIRYDEQVIKLISFEDITLELDKNEMESWQKLIRVLTHEIMNSISPVTSLTSVISGYFINKENKQPLSASEINDHTVRKTIEGLVTIEETGKGLLDFVDRYRSLTSLPVPKITRFRLDAFFSKCKLLMQSNIPENIRIITETEPLLELSADAAQVEQMLINLIKNAGESIGSSENGLIRIMAFNTRSFTILQVKDNGRGIDDDIIENIFIPFYTTKKNGSGIGLSVCRQIMRNHNGTISVNPDSDRGAVFTLRFPDY